MQDGCIGTGPSLGVSCPGIRRSLSLSDSCAVSLASSTLLTVDCQPVAMVDPDSQPHRTARAFQVRGGRWIRAPRPRPHSVSEATELFDAAPLKPAQLTTALINAVTPLIVQLKRDGEADAASIVQALCDHFKSRERTWARERCRRRRFVQAYNRLHCAKVNLHGQNQRNWVQVQRLNDKIETMVSQRCPAVYRPP